MNNKFDEMAKGLAQSVTRRQALKKFGVGLAGMALACFGLANEARADKNCAPPNWCDRTTNLCCCKNGKTWVPQCDSDYTTCAWTCGFGAPRA